MTERHAAIDVGTNTVLLLVAERRDGRLEPVVERAEITRLGRGVDRGGRLDAAAIAETVAVLARYAGEARALGARTVACVATSAARDASNSAEFFAAACAAAGLVPEVISGEEEARLVYHSARREASRLAGLAPAGARLVAVAGTVTTLAAVEQALPAYAAERVHGSPLTLEALEALEERLGELSIAERAALPGMEPKRADVIVAGCAIVLEAMRTLGFERLTVSDRGVRWGLLYDRFGVTA